ncbi:MAG TPA: hypothetical protein VIF62_21675 [Labilithrix sp.]|jgi:hypothetical protein
MKRLHPSALVSAVLLYVLLAVLGALVASIVPWLLAFGEEHPRLAALIWLGLVLSPVYSVATGHHVVHAVLDGVDPGRRKLRRGLLPGVPSWWAGVYGWLVTVMSTLVAAFLMSALFPPERRGLFESLASMVPHNASVTVHTAIWIGCATLLYQFERVARAKAAE